MALPPAMYEVTCPAIVGVINIIFATYFFVIRKELGISNIFSFSWGSSNHNEQQWTEGRKF